MMKKIVGAASVLAIAGAIAMPASAPAQDLDVSIVAPCPNGVWQCVEDVVDWTGDTAGSAAYWACRLIWGEDCSIPQP